MHNVSQCDIIERKAVFMRLQISKSKNAESFYVVKSVYDKGKKTSKIVEKLGTYEKLLNSLNGQNPYVWAKGYVDELNRLDKEGKEPKVITEYSSSTIIPKNNQQKYNCGYLFLQKIYHELGIDKICKEIKRKYNFEYDLNNILSRLVYSRIIYPGSKKKTFELSKKFLEEPKFELHQIYKALDTIAKENDFIQSSVYENSKKISQRKTNIIYYDCTNYFFETEQEEGLKQYGISKEHRPNPIVQMGLFMDSQGIPLAFCINNGNTNEQTTLQPLEKKLLRDFKLSKFVVCTDAGLASTANRKFNDVQDRGFITTQSVKKLKPHIKEWVFDPKGWRITGDNKAYDISKIDESEDRVYYKEQWIKEDGLEQKMIVTYSVKYKNYQRNIRNNQVQRATKAIENGATFNSHKANDYKRFIEKNHLTPDGEIANKALYRIKDEAIANEEKYDGFYAICTNLEGDASSIIRVNSQRWEIEECFRIMKSEFRARPVYLSLDERIKAHFCTCFLSLIIYRYLEKRLGEEFTCPQIVEGLREMELYKIKNEGFIPVYTRDDFTDKLHEVFGFRTDFEIVSNKQVKNIFKITKS